MRRCGLSRPAACCWSTATTRPMDLETVARSLRGSDRWRMAPQDGCALFAGCGRGPNMAEQARKAWTDVDTNAMHVPMLKQIDPEMDYFNCQFEHHEDAQDGVAPGAGLGASGELVLQHGRPLEYTAALGREGGGTFFDGLWEQGDKKKRWYIRARKQGGARGGGPEASRGAAVAPGMTSSSFAAVAGCGRRGGLPGGRRGDRSSRPQKRGPCQ
ncbi:unnamed protein product, partial [Prorocentrum cordatum]